MNRWFSAGLVVLAAISPSESGFARGSTWSGNGPFGGFIVSLATAPTDPLVVFAGTSAGVYKSVDGGHSWIGPQAGIPLTQVSGIAIDAANPERVFAAVGSQFGDGSLSGLYRSLNGGLTWSRILVGGPFTAVKIDSHDTKRVYAGPNSDGSLLRSLDGGETWAAVSISGVGVTTIEVSPISGSLFVCGGGVYRSDDDGNSWTLLSSTYAWYSMTVLPTTPETILLGDVGGTGISKSTDGGKTWNFSRRGLPLKPIGFCPSCTLPVTALASDPGNPNHVFAGLYGDGVFTSWDGGDSWSREPSGIPRDARVLSFAFPPQSTLVGIDGGVYAIKGRTASPSNEGLKASIVYGITVTPSSQVFAASGEGISQSGDYGESWKTVASPSPGLASPGIWAHPGSSGLVFAASAYGGLLRSADHGQSWNVVVEDGQFLRVTHVGFDPRIPSRILAGTAPLPYHPMTILRSDDDGTTWLAVAASSSYTSVLWVGFDPFDESVAFATMDGLGLLRSKDHGATWAGLNIDAWDSACWAVHSVVLGPWGEHTIYSAGMGRVVCRSDDSGLTFHPTVTEPSNRTITALLSDPRRPGTFYAASSYNPDAPILNSALVSSDYGATWSELQSGFPGTGVLSMALDASSSRLFAGTAGSGVVSISLPGYLRVVQPPQIVKRH